MMSNYIKHTDGSVLPQKYSRILVKWYSIPISKNFENNMIFISLLENWKNQRFSKCIIKGSKGWGIIYRH